MTFVKSSMNIMQVNITDYHAVEYLVIFVPFNIL
jgi:hypothetical protein